MEWVEFKDSLCPGGCGFPRHESFSPETDDQYTAEVFECHACAARDRKAHIRAVSRGDGEPPDPGIFYVVTRDDD